MLVDNENSELKIHQWIQEYTDQGKMALVTGYFTVPGLAFLARVTSDKISDYRFILGDITHPPADKERGLDLLNSDITIENAFRLHSDAQAAVAFLEREKVLLKTLEPNFCHAKAYIYTHPHDERLHYFITGSSNLTEAGIGLKHTNNVELNIAQTGNDSLFKKLTQWFDSLWNRPQAHHTKTLIEDDGAKRKIPFKQYLIDEIKKIYREYTPREIYLKVLFELFGQQLLLEKEDPRLNRQIGRLEATEIYNVLYEFQRKGVISLIKMLEKYNGAILADAVGLGKTWSALAVMKFYQMQGREVILLCPKKLEHNWRIYQKNHDSRFEKDALEFFIRYHTDLEPERMQKYPDRSDKYFTNEKPKLFVIDESHNLRNDKSQRYQFLLQEILQRNSDAKVLLLSATPINNTLLDIRNQFKLMVHGDSAGFEETLNIRNLDYLFRNAQQTFKEWTQRETPRISDFVKNLPADFFHLTDSLIVARTRAMVEGEQDNLKFPRKKKPENIFVTPRDIGEFHSFEEIFDAFPPRLSGYSPAFYIEQSKDVGILHDEQLRDIFLIKMMYILLVKRLESSWYSFYSTVSKVLFHHQNALGRIAAYRATKKDAEINGDTEEVEYDDDLVTELDEFTLGKKRKIKLSQIDAAGNLDNYQKDLQKDVEALQKLEKNLRHFENRMAAETSGQSIDIKLQRLIERIEEKRTQKANHGNPKVLIFTTYKDTAFYLLRQLQKRGFDKIAAVSGDVSQVWDEDHETQHYEPILERFAPFTKLFREKEWNFEPSSEASATQQFEEWKNWIAENHAPTQKKLQNPIDILIATDTLSEGQNLQDCDMVINYDIHWNPVRVIQRMGRIDRLGSPNETIFGINFWPSENINKYLDLQGRIERRMAAVKLAGAEVPNDITHRFEAMAEDKTLEQRQIEKMLQQMEDSWDDIDTGGQHLGFDDLSLEIFRQELLEELQKDEQFFRNMPRGVYSGYRALPEVCPRGGLVALLGNPPRQPGADITSYRNYELVYIDEDGNSLFQNHREVLDVLSQHKHLPRHVPEGLDQSQPEVILHFAGLLNQWLSQQAATREVQEDGNVKTTMGKAGVQALKGIMSGTKSAIEAAKDGPATDKYKEKEFDLIAWFAISE